jgi:hypothetical protein
MGSVRLSFLQLDLQLLCLHSFPIACRGIPHVWSLHCKIGPCHFVTGQFAFGADLYSVYLTLKYAAGERAGATRRMAVGNLPLRNLFLGSSSLGLCLSLFSICNLLLFRAAASLARKLLGMVRLWHSLRSHGSVQSLSSLNVSLSSSDRSLES